jgi:hypothetical protein
MENYTVPAGTYYLGDPCYALQGTQKAWMKILNSSDHFKKPYKVGRKIAIAFSTAFGDGEYYDQFNNKYPVDAGMIGVVPISLSTKETPKGMLRVRFEKPTKCSSVDGVLTFGKYKIDTDPHWETEE